MRPRLVVMVSGNGSNLQALIDAVAAGSLDVDIAGVVSNRADAFGLERARSAGVPTAIVALEGESRSAFDRRLAGAVSRFQPDLVVLAGFMRILTREFLDRFAVVNLHPALPGAFAGTNAIERAFASWQAGEIDVSGVMVHWVPDEGVDVGPEIATAVVPFLPGDTLETFAARMHRTEHRLLVEAVAQVCGDGSLPRTGSESGQHPRPDGEICLQTEDVSLDQTGVGR